MGSHALSDELLRQLESLAPEERRQVLDFARALSARLPRGTPGWTLSRFRGRIPRKDLKDMAAEIEAGCEQVRPDEW